MKYNGCHVHVERPCSVCCSDITQFKSFYICHTALLSDWYKCFPRLNDYLFAPANWLCCKVTNTFLSVIYTLYSFIFLNPWWKLQEECIEQTWVNMLSKHTALCIVLIGCLNTRKISHRSWTISMDLSSKISKVCLIVTAEL